jgi:acetylornithine deacetylase/succinyl-diaminopimelate desuccinylase-like protein
MQKVVDLLCEMIAFDSRSSVSNVPLANFMQSQLDHWEIERIDYVDAEYSRMAPSLILGPGNIDVAHKPAESISIGELKEAVGNYERIARELPTFL